MRLLPLAAVCLLPLAASAAPAPPSPKDVQAFLDALNTHPRLPLAPLVSGQSTGEHNKAPLVAVGRLSAKAKGPTPLRPRPNSVVPGLLPHLSPGEYLEQYVTGKEHLLAPSADEPTWLILTGPKVNSMEWCYLTRATRDGNTITVLMDAWTDDGDRSKNIPHRDVHALTLGKLGAGEYTVRVVWRNFHLEVGKDDSYYRWNEVRAGRLKVEVSKPSERADAATAAVLFETDLGKGLVPGGEQDRLWQRSAAWSVPLAWAGNRDRMPKLGLRVGAFNLDKWLEGEPKTDRDLPALNKPAKGAPAYALVVGPSLNTGEWASLREVEWKKDKETKVVVLRVEVWRDDGPRFRNAAHLPVLVVPLEHLEDGRYRVEVEWLPLRAATARDPYRPEDPTKPNKLAESMKDVSRQEFTLGKP